MTRPVAVLRPEPGNARTAAAVEALGLRAIRLPLFAYRALDWRAPDPADFDALLLTSAASARLAGPELDRLRTLPVVAVGPETAAAAERSGLAVAAVGRDGVDAALALAGARGFGRLLHLAGRERMPDRPGVTAVEVYGTEPLPAVALSELEGAVALVHSARAARRLAALLPPDAKRRVAVAALSPAALAAAGAGWAEAAAAPAPSDAALLDLARRLARRPAD